MARGIFFMNKFDNKHPISWRFNDEYCNIPESERNSIIFIKENCAKFLWEMHLSESHFSLIPNGKYNIKKILQINFKEFEKTKSFLSETIKGETLLFFWSEKHASVVNKLSFLNYWDDFIYPSDESDVIISNSGLYLVSNESVFSTDIVVNFDNILANAVLNTSYSKVKQAFISTQSESDNTIWKPLPFVLWKSNRILFNRSNFLKNLQKFRENQTYYLCQTEQQIQIRQLLTQ